MPKGRRYAPAHDDPRSAACLLRRLDDHDVETIVSYFAADGAYFASIGPDDAYRKERFRPIGG
ncbi:MAG: hypothetical protein U9O18_03890 [Chloroflexota bacterium]|nr:hypothetical protein [Chloroflexota bacterium]